MSKFSKQKYGKWSVSVRFESGFVHNNVWHAAKDKAQEIVVQEAQIKHELEFGNRGVIVSYDVDEVV
jgi:hypothetical protein